MKSIHVTSLLKGEVGMLMMNLAEELIKEGV